jgi:hypothetical protein
MNSLQELFKEKLFGKSFLPSHISKTFQRGKEVFREKWEKFFQKRAIKREEFSR